MEFANDKVDEINNKINFDTCQGPGYNFSCLVKNFANLTRYGYNFKPIEVSILEDKKEYAQAVAMFAILGGIVALGLVVLLFFFCCCNCMFRSRATKQKTRPAGRTTIVVLNVLVIVFAIICAASFAIGFIGQRRLHHGVDDMHITVIKVHDTVANISQQTDNIADTLNLSPELDALESYINNVEKSVAIIKGKWPGQENNLPHTEEYTKQIGEIKKYIESSTSTVSDQLKKNALKDIVPTLKNIQDDYGKYAMNVKNGTLAALIVFMVISLLFIIGFCHSCLRITTGIIGFIFFTLSMILGMLFFVVLVVGSDGCLYAKPLIEKEVDQPVLNYYLHCNKTTYHKKSLPMVNFLDPTKFVLPTISNFDFKTLKTGNIEDLFNKAKELINNAMGVVSTLKSSIEESKNTVCAASNLPSPDPGLKKELAKICDNLKNVQDSLSENAGKGSLGWRIKTILTSMGAVLQTVDCSNVSPMINDSFTTICQDVYNSFFLFLVNFVIATGIFFILLFLNIWLLFTN